MNDILKMIDILNISDVSSLPEDLAGYIIYYAEFSFLWDTRSNAIIIIEYMEKRK